MNRMPPPIAEVRPTDAADADAVRTDVEREVERLFRDFADSVYRYARLRLGPEEAHDVVAEVFVVAWRRLADVGENEHAWLLGVARRVVANRVRAARRREALTKRSWSQPVRQAPDPAGEVAEHDVVIRALARLRPADREVIELLASAELSMRELGTALDCRPGTAAVRAHRAKARFREALSAEDETWQEDRR